MSQDFLSRWSRRKRDARRADGREPDAARDSLDARGEAPAAATEPRVTAPATEPAEITAEELARLPRPEELTAESDLAAFLRKGVPEALRNAALRRMWSLDPAIRDFVGHARDYAYDWNTPGGVPGFGPLSSAEIAEAMTERLESLSAESGTPATRVETHQTAASQDRDPPSYHASEARRSISGADAASQNPATHDGTSSPVEERSSEGRGDASDAAGESGGSAAAQRQPHRESREAAPARRHGGAKPV